MNFSRGLLIVAMGTLLAVQGSAQNDALEHELNQLYSKQLAAEKMIQDQQAVNAESASVAVAAPEATAAAAAAPNVTVNQVTVTSPQAAAASESLSAPMEPAIQSQKIHQTPTTTIEASPLSPSRADQLRKARQDVEVQTEQSIVEQLEASRLELEKKRAESLLKKISSADEVAPQSVQVVPAAPAAVAPVAPVDDSEQKAEISQLKQEVQNLKTEKERPRDDNYMSFGIGMPNYQNVINLKSDASFGIGVGFKSPNNVVFEGSLYYSLLRIERPTTSPFGGLPEIDNVDQFNGMASVKYAFFSGKVRPLIGALASYTYREYSCGQFWTCNGRSKTHALDAGGLVGGEVQVSDTFSVGVEYQYLRNLSNRTEASIQPSFMQMYPTGRLEDKDYSLITVRGRVSF